MIFVGFFLSHCTKKVQRCTFLCFTNCLLSKQLLDKRGGESNTIFRPKCFVSQCRKKSYRNPSVCH